MVIARAILSSVYRHRIALVMQDLLLFDTSVFDNIDPGLRSQRGVSKDEVRDKVPFWLERLGVEHLAQRRAGQLSGGVAQRVSLSRTLVLEPQLLVLDELFSTLEDLGAMLKETSATTHFVTHNLPKLLNLQAGWRSSLGIVCDRLGTRSLYSVPLQARKWRVLYSQSWQRFEFRFAE